MKLFFFQCVVVFFVYIYIYGSGIWVSVYMWCRVWGPSNVSECTVSKKTLKLAYTLTPQTKLFRPISGNIILGNPQVRGPRGNRPFAVHDADFRVEGADAHACRV